MKNKIYHAVLAVVLFAIPMILVGNFSWLNLTVGGVLNAIYLYVSQLANPTAPIK